MNATTVTAPTRAYGAPVPREGRTLDADSKVASIQGAADGVATVDGDADVDVDVDTSIDALVDNTSTDGTRSVQDLIAAALKMFASPEPKPEPVAQQPPVIQEAAKIEHAVQLILDQIVAKPAMKAGDGFSSNLPFSDEDSASDERSELATPDAPIGAFDVQMKTDTPMTSKGPVATTAVREPAPLPENPNPSHVHLVIDDGPERVVVTVAVRGNEVNATIRGGDEQTAAAIARNAASLDHALRTNGLDLSSFSAERDLDHRAPREHTPREQTEEEEETA